MAQEKRLSFVGGGVMAEAIISQVLASGVASNKDIKIGEKDDSRRRYLSKEYGTVTSAENLDIIGVSQIIVVAVKPQQIGEVLSEIKGKLESSQTIMSIAAGIQIGRIVEMSGHSNVIRVMPNTPSQIGKGVSVWANTSEVGDNNLSFADNIIAALGESVHVQEEKYLDMATAVSASGPAYVFTFLEALVDAGVHIGLSRDMSEQLAINTVIGSALLARDTDKHLSVLRNMVTSPGGTTAEALLTLETGGFRGTVIDAVIAAYKKSLSLGGY